MFSNLTTIFNEEKFEYSACDLLECDEEEQTKVQLYCDVNVVHVTPSSIKVMRRERTEGHRALRHRMFTDADEFCLVYFKPEPDKKYINKDDSYKTVLKSGILICNIQIDQKRTQLGDFSHIKNVEKSVARVGLWISKTIPTGITLNYTVNDFDRQVQNGNYCVTKINGIERNGYCFTDGNGFISKGLARLIAEKLGYRIKTMNQDIYPSAYQIRLAGCKGLVVVELQSTLDQFYIKIRESMEKFKLNEWNLEICEGSRSIPTRLNNQILLIMSDLGVSDETFLNLQDKWFQDKERPPSAVEDLLKNKLPLSVNECRYMFGCAFESVLGPGQCFIRYQVVDKDGKPLKEPQFKTVVGPVIVTKNPCPYASYMLVLEAVDCSELNCLADVIVFSTDDNRPDSNKISGSDLDGDHYFVRQHLQLSRKVEPLDYASLAKTTSVDPKPKTYYNIIKHCYLLLGATNYGEIYNLHATVVDKNLEKCPQRTCQKVAIELANMFSIANDEIRKPYGYIYPDFLMKDRSYESQTIAGKLYRRAVVYKNANPNRLYNSDMDLRANSSNNVNMFLNLIKFQESKETD
ncbi:unnamed protein product [Rotaria sp. Silwood1]|nr:unnamed protein product [Rotaria sp. Silwood1]CAF1639294.1 unnamed protein product [Rotaria sp. Silwood1]